MTTNKPLPPPPGRAPVPLPPAVQIEERWLPKHDGGLIVRHNSFKTCYETAREWRQDWINYLADEWPTEKDFERSMETNSVWEIRWRSAPNEEAQRVFASTLHEALRHAKKVSQS